MAKILKIIGGILGGIILLLVIASIVIIMIVDKKMIEDQMKSALNRHVTIKNIDVGIFSVLSGIEVEEVAISNFKSENQIKALEGKAVNGGDIFIGLKSFKFKVKFLPLLSNKFVLKELTLYEPKINIIKGVNGGYNFDDLTRPAKLTAEEKAQLEKQRKEEEKEKKEAKKVEETPKEEGEFTVDNLPYSLTIGKVGIENGTLTFNDKQLNQTFQVYNLTVLVHSIEIDPEDLKNKNTVKINFKMGVKTIGTVKSGTVKTFDIAYTLDGNVIPFDLKTRKLNPEVAVNTGSPYGTVTGLQVFEKIKTANKLSKYTGNMNFLKDTQKWKDAFMKAWYKNGVIKMQDGKIKTEDFDLLFAGTMNVKTKAINYDMDMVLDDKHKKEIREGIKKNVKKAIPSNMSKYVKPDDVTDSAMKPLLNKDGKVYFGFKVTGKTNSPDTKLVRPKLPSLGSIVKDAAGNAGDVIKDKAKEEAKKATSAAKKEAASQVKKSTKKLKKKLPF